MALYAAGQCRVERCVAQMGVPVLATDALVTEQVLMNECSERSAAT